MRGSPNGLRMTQARKEVVALLEGRTQGVPYSDIAKALPMKANTLVVRMCRMKKDNIICSVGRNKQVRWCLPEHLAQTKALHVRMVNNAKQRRAKYKADWRRADRSMYPTQTIVRAGKAKRMDIPAVNSVWSLAA